MDLNNLKIKLETEEKLLQQELGEIGVSNKDNPNDWDVTPADRKQEIEFRDEMADRLEDLEERASAKTTLEARLKEVRHALRKMSANQYGFCEISGEPIEEERLNANPAARTNIKNKDEEANLPPINL